MGEARSVVAACAALLRQNCAPRDIAVITPYKAQQHEIRARQGVKLGPNLHVENDKHLDSQTVLYNLCQQVGGVRTKKPRKPSIS